MNKTISLQSGDIAVTMQNNLHEDEEAIPPDGDFLKWVENAYYSVQTGEVRSEVDNSKSLVLRLVSEQESQALNQQFRQKNAPTNVLSFYYEQDDIHAHLVDEPLHLGDIVLCHSVIRLQAKQQAKQLVHHYAHMITHGLLHLFGYDHIDEGEAKEMEQIEIDILAKLHIANPYI